MTHQAGVDRDRDRVETETKETKELGLQGLVQISKDDVDKLFSG